MSNWIRTILDVFGQYGLVTSIIAILVGLSVTLAKALIKFASNHLVHIGQQIDKLEVKIDNVDEKIGTVRQEIAVVKEKIEARTAICEERHRK